MSTDYLKIDVEELLPHSGDMVLIDQMVDYGDDYGVSRVTVKPDDKFFEEAINGIHSTIGLEWMAQTIAAIAGIEALSNHRPVQVGFLLGSRKYEPSKSIFSLGEEYIIHVKQLYREENGLGAFQCTIHEGDNLIADAKLNVFAPDNVEQFLKGENE
jgi:predicted hotdog family 3-hydroxylacyl-ACP dehydratase